MDKFTDVLVTLQNEGYDFSVFVRKRGESNQGSVSKFSHAYVTPAAKQLLPLNVWDLVEDESVLGQDSQPKDGMLDYRTTKLHLDNLGSLERYLQNAFKHLRQVPCKSIVKVWIKAIEPRKKTKYPYIKGEVTKPNWWPKNVQHREPDHLQKDDRMRLMTSIILAVLPGLRDRMILDDLYQTTLSLSLFKREPHKNLVLQSVFDISQALCNNDDGRTVDVIDLTQFGARQKDAHFESINKLAATKNVIIQSGKLVSEDACGSLQPGQAIDSPSALSAPMLIDLLIAGDQSLLDGLGYSVFEESSTLPLY